MPTRMAALLGMQVLDALNHAGSTAPDGGKWDDDTVRNLWERFAIVMRHRWQASAVTMPLVMAHLGYESHTCDRCLNAARSEIHNRSRDQGNSILRYILHCHAQSRHTTHEKALPKSIKAGMPVDASTYVVSVAGSLMHF